MENVYEQFFYLKYKGNWGFQEAYNLPVKVREWFFKKLIDQINKENENSK